jgi:hypothetical protein
MTVLPLHKQCRHPSISIEAFEASAVDPDQFDHEAHVYVAWLYLQHHELNDAIARFCLALKRLTKKLGVESKYHETITWFFMISINERLQMRSSGDWASFKQENPDLFATNPSLIGRHYSGERLQSTLARTQFLLPDRLPI